MEKRYTINDLLTMNRGQVAEVNGVQLRYDGAYGWIEGDDKHQWTLMTSYIDKNGCDRKKSTFGFSGLKEIGVI